MRKIKYTNNISNSISKGFSLIELIIMLIIIGFIAAIAVTRLSDISINVRLSSAMNQISSDIELVKEIALARHQSMSITYDLDLNIYTIRKNNIVMNEYPGSNDGIISLSEGLFSGVNITNVNINGSNRIEFDKWGNALNGGSITLNEEHTIFIDKLTGFTKTIN